MKKTISVVLVLLMALSLVTLTSCGEEKHPYSAYKLADYVTLPDYDSYEYALEVAEVTEEDIQNEIDTRLEELATSETVTEGTVQDGDTLNISFEGKLADGTSVEGMSSEGTTIVLGQTKFIDGFLDPIYGAKIGDTVTSECVFPDPYELNEDLSGKAAVFTITIISKTVTTVPELTEEFVKENSDYASIEEFTADVKADLEEAAKEDADYQLKSDIYNKILEEATVSETIADKVSEEATFYDEFYKSMAESNGMEWADFVTEYFGWTEDEYQSSLEEAAANVVETSMIVYALADKEGVKVTTKEYEQQLADFCTSLGYEDAASFEANAGFPLETYANLYGLRLNTYLEAAMEKIIERNLSK